MRRYILVIVGLMVFSVCSLAQEYQEGIPWGNAYFKPSVEFIFTHSDNVFRTNETMGTVVDDNIWMIRPKIGFEFPFENSYVNLDIAYEYKDYEHYELVNHESWAVALTSQFKFSNDSVLSINDHFIQGVQQVEQFDPGMEVYWNVTKFTRNQATVDYSLPVSTLNTISFHLKYNELDFKEGEESGTMPFFAYTQAGGGLGWRYNYQPLAAMIMEWEYTDSDPKTDNFYYSPVGVYTTEKKYKENRLSFGWEGNAKRKLSGNAKIGYKKMDFNNDYDDFRGIVADAALTLKLSEFSDMSATVFRHADQSAFNVNNYYTATGLDLRLHHQFNRYLFGTLGGKYQSNDYPEGVSHDVDGDGYTDASAFWYLRGQHRNDDIMQFLAEIGYHFTPRISMRLNYLYEDRDSNLTYLDIANVFRKPYSYTENRLVFQVQMGW